MLESMAEIMMPIGLLRRSLSKKVSMNPELISQMSGMSPMKRNHSVIK